jgi:hypothetical protein
MRTIPRLAPAAAGKIASWCCFGVLLSATALAATAPAARIAGDWVLDETASGNFDAAVAAYMADSVQRLKQRRVRRFDVVEQIAGPTDEVPPEEGARTRERLVEAFKPAASFKLSVNGQALSIVGDDGQSRSYNLEESATRMDSSGISTITARWTGAALLIRSKFTNKALHLQQLTPDKSGAVLKVTLQVKDPASAQLQLTSVYRRKAAT